ncbi:cytosolic phospholipase A2 epsilon-like [Lacerta agilis]|uniref:cytosolic phospholipase A2 epsilon-like n=1 Tax=Lacerta agilis TaxID=80427 RepID=UPI00141953FD|nr:cytosolic phospholipase A2 epsilon-like [Lacerta agilis]
MEACGSLSNLVETSPCCLLSVRVIRARNLRRADTLSHTDCYLTLWLPTASSERFQTKTVQNSKDPVWNETFHFMVQSKVKNILELSVFDEDVCQDEQLFTIRFDIARLPLNEKVLLYFSSNPKDQEKLEVEFELRNSLSVPETIVTNGTLVAREVCYLEFEIEKKERQKSKHELSLMMKGSHEGHQELSSGQSSFHYVKYKHPTMDVKLPKKDLDYAFGPCSYNRKERSLRLDINSLPTSKKIVLAEICIARENRSLVPVVAIMTTGGSTRSLTACYGSLRGLQKLNLLDCATYITGLSGTTWTMANLYRDAYWSKKDLDEQINEVKRQVTKCKLDGFSIERLKYYNRQLCQRKEEGQRTSCIDLWGLFIEYLLNDGEDNHKLSEQQQAINEGQNPLPIYTAINVKEKYSTLDFNEWIEFTPYEVGILKYGAFVRAEDFGSEFFMGRLMKRIPETRICYMQGMWSSIFSLNLLYVWNNAQSPEDFWHKWTQDQIADIDTEPHLPSRPHEQKTHLYTPAGPLSSAFRDVLTDRLSVAQYHNFLRGLQLDNGYLENDSFRRWKGTILDASSPNQLTQTEEYLSLEDTGFFINTSVAPLLRKERKADIIIHLNYSAGSQLLPLEQSCKYCAEQGIPFPKAVIHEDDKHLKECYLFDNAENPEAPILVFFPQVNDSFHYYKHPVLNALHQK